MARSVLIVKLAAIGDVVMALPMVTALRASDPAVRVHWMAGRGVAPLLREVDGIDEVIEVDESAVLVGNAVAKMRAVAAAWRAVAGRRYDAVYVAHADRRYRLLAAPVLASERSALDGHRGRKRIIPGRCHRDEYIRLVSGIDDQQARRYAPPAIRARLGPTLEAELRAANPEGRPLVAITPGGARNVARNNPLRRWPLERYADLAGRLRDAGYCVVVTGDADDGPVREAFPPGSIVDLVGRTDVPQLVAVFRECAAVVAHDSGPMHLAGLAGAPVIALLGPTPPSMFFRPGDPVRVLWPGGALPCAPCYDGRDFARCTNNRCMQMIEVPAVAALVHAIAPLPSPRGGTAATR